jgi:hypothetical protein
MSFTRYTIGNSLAIADGWYKHCNGSGAAVEFRSQIQVEEAPFVSAVETAVSRDKAQATHT